VESAPPSCRFPFFLEILSDIRSLSGSAAGWGVSVVVPSQREFPGARAKDLISWLQDEFGVSIALP
jgi:hypothetical protein